MVDVADPGAEYGVARYQAEARIALGDIQARGARALLVGGTGLYLRAVVDGLHIPGQWPELAASLHARAAGSGGCAQLHAQLRELDPVAAARIEPGNARRVVRALEVTLGSGQPFSSFGDGLGRYAPSPVTMVGIPLDRPAVDRQIARRLASWMEQGLVGEVQRLARRRGGLSRTARQALAYRELLAHIEDGAPLEACLAEAETRTRNLARRQWSWFRRDPRIRWLDPSGDLVAQLLAVWDEAPAVWRRPAQPVGIGR